MNTNGLADSILDAKVVRANSHKRQGNCPFMNLLKQPRCLKAQVPSGSTPSHSRATSSPVVLEALETRSTSIGCRKLAEIQGPRCCKLLDPGTSFVAFIRT